MEQNYITNNYTIRLLSQSGNNITTSPDLSVATTSGINEYLRSNIITTTTIPRWDYTWPINGLQEAVNDAISDKTDDKAMCSATISEIEGNRYFSNLPMWKYKIRFFGNILPYLHDGWPYLFGQYKDWILLHKVVSSSEIEVIAPLHVRLRKDIKFAPLNQFDNGFENQDVVDFMNE